MEATEGRRRTRGEETRDVAVVGGGLAGLTAGAFLARAGLDAVVFEMKSEVGGRARTAREEGFAFNEGAHALYRSGTMARTARDLGIDLSGGSGPTWATWAVQGERLFRLPVSAPGLALTTGLGWREKYEFGRLLARLGRLDPDDHSGTPLGPWIARRLDSSTNRALLRALVRLTTYYPDEDLDAAAAVSAVQKGNRGVLYLDGGWQTLVDGLRSRAREAGAHIETSTRVAAVEWEGTPLTVRTRGGDRTEAEHAVLAVRPSEAVRLADPTPPSLEEAARSASPVRVAALDSTEASCRQHVSRARRRLEDERVRYEASRAEAEELRRAFAAASLEGDLERLVSLLADDAVHFSDGGGEVPAAREPVRGAENVARLLAGVVEGADEEVRVVPVDVNGTPGLMARVGDRLASVVSFAVEDGEITRIYQVLSPTKLRGAAGRRGGFPGPE